MEPNTQNADPVRLIRQNVSRTYRNTHRYGSIEPQPFRSGDGCGRSRR